MTEKIGDGETYALATAPRGSERAMFMHNLVDWFAENCHKNGIDVTFGMNSEHLSVAQFRVLSRGVDPEAFRQVIAEFSAWAETPLWVASAHDANGASRIRSPDPAENIRAAAIFSSAP